MNRIRRIWKWLDRRLTVGSWKIRPIARIINRKLDPGYMHRRDTDK